jgi:hypothetical protein
MRLCAELSRVEFALLARPRATSRATDSLYLFESGLLGLHGSFMMRQFGEEKWSKLHSDDTQKLANAVRKVESKRLQVRTMFAVLSFIVQVTTAVFVILHSLH